MQYLAVRNEPTNAWGTGFYYDLPAPVTEIWVQMSLRITSLDPPSINAAPELVELYSIPFDWDASVADWPAILAIGGNSDGSPWQLYSCGESIGASGVVDDQLYANLKLHARYDGRRLNGSSVLSDFWVTEIKLDDVVVSTLTGNSPSGQNLTNIKSVLFTPLGAHGDTEFQYAYIKMGTSEGDDDLFYVNYDVEGASFPAGWTGYQVGAEASIAIAGTPTPPVVPTIAFPANSPIGIPRPLWQYILCHTPDPTDPTGELEEIGELESARGKTLELVRNRPGSAQCSISMYDDMAQHVFDKLDIGDVRGSIRKTILVRRNKRDVWSGPIATISGSLQEGSSACTLNAVGWLEYLFQRELEANASYLEQPQDTIAFNLMQRANDQEPEHPLPVFPGSVIGFMPLRSPVFNKGESFGASLQKLSDVESGFDFDVHPRTREVNLYAWDAYRVLTNIKLGLGWGPDNIRQMDWNENGFATRNRLIVSGTTGVPISAQDTQSQDEYGLFTETINLPGAGPGILPAYANAELVVKSRPQLTYSLFPKQITEVDDGSPRLFEDFLIGDQISFTAKDGYFEVKDQGIRLFGASISISDDGNFEAINSLMISPAS